MLCSKIWFARGEARGVHDFQGRVGMSASARLIKRINSIRCRASKIMDRTLYKGEVEYVETLSLSIASLGRSFH